MAPHTQASAIREASLISTNTNSAITHKLQAGTRRLLLWSGSVRFRFRCETVWRRRDDERDYNHSRWQSTHVAKEQMCDWGREQRFKLRLQDHCSRDTSLRYWRVWGKKKIDYTQVFDLFFISSTSHFPLALHFLTSSPPRSLISSCFLLLPRFLASSFSHRFVSSLSDIRYGEVRQRGNEKVRKLEGKETRR